MVFQPLIGISNVSHHSTALEQENHAISEDWRDEVVLSSDEWSRAENQAGTNFEYMEGESGGVFVSVDEYGRRAYLKPVKSRGDLQGLERANQKARAACEKIASDLAYELGLPVPPAILSKRHSPQDQWCEEEVVLSLVMYPRQWSWAQVRQYGKSDDSPEDAALAKALSQCTPMLAFDTWIDQRDHEYSPHNIVWGYEKGKLERSEIVFLDFAYSLGSGGGDDFDGRWSDEGWKPVTPAGFPSMIMRHIDPGRLETAISEIEDLPEEVVLNVVDRIPSSYLPSWRAENIKEGLLGRRRELRSALSDILSN